MTRITKCYTVQEAIDMSLTYLTAKSWPLPPSAGATEYVETFLRVPMRGDHVQHHGISRVDIITRRAA